MSASLAKAAERESPHKELHFKDAQEWSLPARH